MIVRGTVRGGGEGKDGEGRGGIGEGARGAGSSEEERAEASAARDKLVQDTRDRGRMVHTLSACRFEFLKIWEE